MSVHIPNLYLPQQAYVCFFLNKRLSMSKNTYDKEHGTGNNMGGLHGITGISSYSRLSALVADNDSEQMMRNYTRNVDSPWMRLLMRSQRERPCVQRGSWTSPPLFLQCYCFFFFSLVVSSAKTAHLQEYEKITTCITPHFPFLSFPFRRHTAA